MLFTSAGMQPLIPYFSGAPHPSGRRLVNVQRCLRTVDIDEVGDDSHLTCFEMLGNWSLGDYYKHESLSWTLEWLLDDRPAVRAPRRDGLLRGRRYARAIWRRLGVPDERVRVLRARGELVGPARPARPLRAGLRALLHPRRRALARARQQRLHRPRAGCRRLAARAGAAQRRRRARPRADRLCCCRASPPSTRPTCSGTRCAVRELSRSPDTRAERIVSDHVRSSVLLVGDGVRPSNSAHGYVLRRLLRRAIRQGRVLGIDGPFVRDGGADGARRPGRARRARAARSAGSPARCAAGCARSSGSRRRRPRALPALRDLRAAARADARGAGRDARLAGGLRARGFRAPRTQPQPIARAENRV